MSEVTVKNNKPLKVLANFCRVLLGITFMFSGIVKAIDPVGTQIKLNDYLYAFGMGGSVLESTLLILACILAGFEILIGAYMLLGAFTRGTTLLTLLMMAFFTPLTLYLAIKNPVQDCGCFGDAVVLTNWQTFFKNVFLLAMAIFVLVERKLIIPFVAERRQWLITVLVTTVAVRFMVLNITGLPVLDFRPYKVGTDLRSAILDIKDPAFTDFSIMDDDMNDVTLDLLNDSGYTFLLVSPYVEDASESDMDLIDDVFDYCAHWGYNMIGVTSSGSEAVRQWTENTGAEFSFAFCDEVPLQTMIRSNPGLVLIKDGVLVNKWSHSRIPQDEELSGPLDEISVGQIPDPDPMHTPWAVALMFILPLLIIVLIDRLREM
ncbi:MAG: DoxX family protein [Bacteroidaceae bacterium]|nr:DoxX family protein [Bacteroidaceae bacterium]